MGRASSLSESFHDTHAAYAVVAEIFDAFTHSGYSATALCEAASIKSRQANKPEAYMDQELQTKLEKLAFERTKPFCYGCYIEASTGRCACCGSDDLMRLMEGVGCEYGVDWVICEILREELTAVNLEEDFEQSIRECYSEEVQVGWLTLDTVSVIKEMDPVSWDCAVSEWQSQEESDGTIVSLDGGANYYRVKDIDELL